MSAQETETTTTCFTVTAHAAPGVLPRVLEYFEKRGLVPDHFEARQNGGELIVEIHARNMDQELARYIGRCMNELLEVDRVLVSEKRYAGVA